MNDPVTAGQYPAIELEISKLTKSSIEVCKIRNIIEEEMNDWMERCIAEALA